MSTITHLRFYLDLMESRPDFRGEPSVLQNLLSDRRAPASVQAPNRSLASRSARSPEHPRPDKENLGVENYSWAPKLVVVRTWRRFLYDMRRNSMPARIPTF